MARGVGAGGGPDERVPARRVDGGGAAGGARRSPLPRAEKLVVRVGGGYNTLREFLDLSAAD